MATNGDRLDWRSITQENGLFPSQGRDDAQLNTALLVGELERAHLAEIIHDDVLQVLGAGLLAAEMCEHSWRLGRTDMLPSQLTNLRGVLEQGIGRLRQLMADVRPYQRENGGLDGALQSVFRTYLERSRGTITFGQHVERPLSNAAEVLAYRLILEALWSVQNLDQPIGIDLELRAQSSELELDVRFSPSQQSAAGDPLASKRVAVLRWHVQALGGRLEQAQVLPVGVQLRVRLPLPA